MTLALSNLSHGQSRRVHYEKKEHMSIHVSLYSTATKVFGKGIEIHDVSKRLIALYNLSLMVDT